MADRDHSAPSRPTAGLDGDTRGVTPAVGKTLEIGMVVLFVALVTTVLLGGIVPDYRAATGEQLGERVLATASQQVEAAVPSTTGTVDVSRSVELPASIAGSSYYLRVDGRALVLDHPDAAIGGRIQLTLSPRVDRVEGRWDSGSETTVRVGEDGDDLFVELRNGGGP